MNTLIDLHFALIPEICSDYFLKNLQNYLSAYSLEVLLQIVKELSILGLNKETLTRVGLEHATPGFSLINPKFV